MSGFTFRFATSILYWVSRFCPEAFKNTDFDRLRERKSEIEICYTSRMQDDVHIVYDFYTHVNGQLLRTSFSIGMMEVEYFRDHPTYFQTFVVGKFIEMFRSHIIEPMLTKKQVRSILKTPREGD